MVASEGLDRIIAIVQETGQIGSIGPSDDFYDAGFSSINALPLLLELETAFNVSIPDEEFVSARTCVSLHALICQLTDAQP